MSKVIQCGTRFYNSNESVLKEEDKKITEIIYSYADTFQKNDSYDEKLILWSTIGIPPKTSHWIGDFSKIKSNFGEYEYPEPTAYISIYPEDFSQLIKFNLFNLNTAIKEMGSYDVYVDDYLESIRNQDKNPLIKVKIRKDLNDLRKKVKTIDFFKGTLQKWYESFSTSQDTLNESHYHLFKDSRVAEFSSIGFGSDEPPYLCYLLNDPRYVFEAADGYLISKKIPFLENLLKKYESIDAINILPPINNDANLIEENTDEKKSKKRAKQISLKQQLILLHKLGMPALIEKLNNSHQAAILSQLFLRSEQDVRSMLTYWGNVNAPMKYNTTLPDDLDKVIDLLEDNNIQS